MAIATTPLGVNRKGITDILYPSGTPVEGDVIQFVGGKWVPAAAGGQAKMGEWTRGARSATASGILWSISLFTNEIFNTLDITKDSNDQITINEAGIYEFRLVIHYAANATGERRAYFRIEGTAPLQFLETTIGASPTGPTSVEFTRIRQLPAGAKVSARTYHTAGVDLGAGTMNDEIFIRKLD